jgi:uncharacterized membrane protein YdbT with pleckstrin-like domain
LGDKENILFVTRQHWLVFFSKILFELAFVILLLIGITVALGSFNVPWAGFLYLLLLIPAFFIIMKFVVWSNQKFIVTNHRVIHIKGVFNKNVIDSSLEKVNDVKLSQSYLGRMLDYGDIEILTASELGVNLLKKIDHPIQYKTAMLNAKEAADHPVFEVNAKSAPEHDLDIPGTIAKLGDLRKQGLITETEFVQKKTELLNKLGKE